jgi:clan AA aspartic protease (TIGR02281 family)
MRLLMRRAASRDGTAALLLALLLYSLSPAETGRPGSPSAGTGYVQAVALARHGREAESAALLRPLVSTNDPVISKSVRLLLMQDERALFHYQAALSALGPLLADPEPQLANRVRLLRALADVPSEMVRRHTPIYLSSPVIAGTIGARQIRFLVDTGASFSVLSRSTAKEAGLHVRPVQYEIKTALGQRIAADVTTGDLAVAGAIIRNVVFLILPDGAIPPGLPYSGVIGLPALRVLGPFNISGLASGRMQNRAPLILVDGSLGLEINLRDTRMQCALDTGSNRSWFASPAGANIPGLSNGREVRTIESAAGSDRKIRARETSLEFSIAGRHALLHRALIMAPPQLDGSSPVCVLGADAVAALAPLTLDFDRMQIVLR